MMDDLPQKLRFHGRFAAEDNDECAIRKIDEREAAAEEIERLRAALEYITKFDEYEPAGPAARFAHLALTEKVTE